MPENDFVLITNGNTMSMIALGEWLIQCGQGLRAIYVTYRLPSSKGNVRGILSMLRKSGWSYTHMKIWANRLLPSRLRRTGLPASVAEFVELCGIGVPVKPVASVNTDEIVREIRSLAPDYLVSFSATHRFREPLIQSPTKGAINTHYGALPAYAGLSPYYWHLHNREKEFGVTLHRIASKLDAGPIIEQVRGDMEGATTALEVLLRMAAKVSPMLIRFFRNETSLENARSQPLKGRSYFRHPTRQQVRQFRSHCYRMLDSEAKKKAIAAVDKLTRRVKA